MSAHVSSAIFRWLKPVRALDSVIHYVPRKLLEAGFKAPLALCGTQAGMTDRGTRRWRIVHAVGSKVCGACHAESCSEPSRVDWS